MYARLFLILLALFSLDAKAQTIQESVAFAIIGEPKYAAGFSHLITSIGAPKGGTLTTAAIGTFDNFNRYALRGGPRYARRRSTIPCSPPRMMSPAATTR